MTAALEVRGLVVELGGRRVLDAIDLTLAPAEHALLVGRSGSGKSTLLRAIAGLERPTAGTVALAGRTVSDGPRVAVPPNRRDVGFLFQGAALWPNRTVAGQLRFALAASGVPRAARKERIAELLAEVDLSDFGPRSVGDLSGGEAQRVALARALATAPKLLLLDEPLGPLDAELRGALLERLDALRARHGFAVLHVTHDPREARHLASRVLRLVNGRLEIDPDSPQEPRP